MATHFFSVFLQNHIENEKEKVCNAMDEITNIKRGDERLRRLYGSLLYIFGRRSKRMLKD